jgi:hypothetical protein
MNGIIMEKKILIFVGFFALLLFGSEIDCSLLESSVKNKSNESESDVSADLLDGKFLKRKERTTSDHIQELFIKTLLSKNKFNLAAKRLAEFCSPVWSILNENLSKIKEWSTVNISPHVKGIPGVFYPFGGPDAAYALRLFPEQKTYILVGCEPIGNFANIEQNIGDPAIADALRLAFSSYSKKGYFITSEMMTQLSGKRGVVGVLCLILAALSISGYDICNVSDLSVDANGNAVERQKGMPDCVKIDFLSPDDRDTVKSMYYVRTNLGNGSKSLSNIMKFVEKEPFVTLVKSASYVLHDRTASIIKNFILDNSKVVLQDDTGIPFRDFSVKLRTFLTFGSYKEPALPIFKQYRQPDLALLFEKEKGPPIPFYCGYFASSKPVKPNLLLATKIAIDKAPLRGGVHSSGN